MAIKLLNMFKFLNTFKITKSQIFVRAFSIRFIGLGFFLFIVFTAVAQDNSYWDKPYIGKNPTLLYYPDQNANYFRYGWENKSGLEIVIKGKMPEARYFSFNLYDDYTKSSIAALADYEILPDETDKSSYTIHIMPQGSAGKYRNLISLPDSVQIASIFLRYYLPQVNIYANAPLPTINFLEAGQLKAPLSSIAPPTRSKADMAKLKQLISANPNIISGKERKLLASSTASITDKEPIISKVMTMPVFRFYTDSKSIGAYNFFSGGNYPNKDNHYIVMPVVRKKDNVLLVRFKAPTHGIQLGDTSKNVRYFSLSEGNEYTNTALTLYDDQLSITKDGFVYVAIANDTKEAREKAIALGINFMPWLYKDKLVLILRHMLPNTSFNYSTNEVPVFDKSKPAKGQEASAYIGEYALIGKFFSKSEWKTISGLQQFGF